MHKRFTDFFESRKKSLFILFIAIVPSFFSLINPGFYFMQDDLQAFRIFEMDKCFTDFQIPCRWVPDAGYQYGYPLFNFYSPGVYYIGELIHLLGFQFIDTLKILFVLGFILAAYAMYLLVNEFFGSFAGVVAGVLYTYAPFKAAEVYVRGSLSEFWAQVFFPLIFWSSYKLIKETKSKNYFIYLSLSLGFLLITHNLLPMLFLPVVGIWILVWTISYKKPKNLLKIFFSFLLGIGLSSFFIIPMIVERKYVHLETLLGGYFDYRQHFVSLKQIFLSNTWGYGSSVLGPYDDLALSSGSVLLFGSILALVLAIAYFSKRRVISLLTIIIAFVELGVLYLMHLKSSFLWERVVILQWLQFPWRLLAVSVFLLSFLSAIAVNLSGRYKYLVGISLVIAVFLLHGSFFRPKEWIEVSDKDKFSGDSWNRQLTISIFDYLPIYAELPPNDPAPEFPEVLDGEASFREYKKGSNYQEGVLEVRSDSIIRLPLFDFPGMVTLVDGGKVNHFRDCRNQSPCLGLITLNINRGLHTVNAKLGNTSPRTIGNIISLLSVLGLLLINFRYEKFQKIFR